MRVLNEIEKMEKALVLENRALDLECDDFNIHDDHEDDNDFLNAEFF